jgi:nitrate/nitrite transporter NarK
VNDGSVLPLPSHFLLADPIPYRSLTGSSASIKSPTTIATLSIAIVLIPAFILWVNRQEGLNRPALIPNSLWRNRIFTCICINVFLIWGAFNASEQIINFFFQKVQKISPLQAALRFLPAPISGTILNLLAGFLVPHVPANWIVIITTVLACIAPLLMVVASPDWTYWALAFPAMFLNPLGSDGLFTISNLLITSVFPAKTQGLAGGVFNTVSQIGKSVGLALVALIANQVTLASDHQDKRSPEALLKGYRASFWFLFGLCSTSLLVSVWGLRKIGKVGKEEE